MNTDLIRHWRTIDTGFGEAAGTWDWTRETTRRGKKKAYWLVILNRRGEFKMRKDRLILGLLCIAFGTWAFLSDTSSAPAIAIGVLGITLVAVSRKR